MQSSSRSWAPAEEPPSRMLLQGLCEWVSSCAHRHLAILAGLVPKSMRPRARCVHGGFSSEHQVLAPGASRASDLGSRCLPRGPWVSVQRAQPLCFPRGRVLISRKPQSPGSLCFSLTPALPCIPTGSACRLSWARTM